MTNLEKVLRFKKQFTVRLPVFDEIYEPVYEDYKSEIPLMTKEEVYVWNEAEEYRSRTEKEVSFHDNYLNGLAEKY